MDLQLTGKRALVTGSTAGIGLAIGTTLASEGATVIINGRSESRVTGAVVKIRQRYPQAKLETLAGDLSKAEVVEQATSRFPHVDILINNLGIYELKAFEDISDEDWMAMIETNFMSGVRLSRHYLPKMRAKNWGRIIFISSESAINIPVEMIHYGVTKTMQLALARGLAETTAGTGVTVNSVLAGPTRSEEVEQFVNDMAKSRGVESFVVEKEFFETVRPSSLPKRFATAEEVAALDVIVQVRTLGANPEAGLADLSLFRYGQTVIGFGEPLTAAKECSGLAAAGVSLLAMELMPRITRAQSLDALSSMATISGYAAVLLAAISLPKMFPMLMTAAGTITAAKVFVLGAGVAGLQAIATARRLGAVVRAYDVRQAVKEQVESVGATFVGLSLEAGTSEDNGGYAKAMDEQFYRRQPDLLTEVLREQDVVITTAAVPDKKAPVLITAAMTGAMAPGSVIVDIVAA